MGNDPHTTLAEAAPLPVHWKLAIRQIEGKKKVPFDFLPSAEELENVATFLKIESLANWRIKGALLPAKQDGWRFEARMTADLTQACGVTLKPVHQRIDEKLLRDLIPEQKNTSEISLNTSELDPEAEDEPDTFGENIDLGALAI